MIRSFAMLDIASPDLICKVLSKKESEIGKATNTELLNMIDSLLNLSNNPKYGYTENSINILRSLFSHIIERLENQEKYNF
jgi:hypothetical protein